MSHFVFLNMLNTGEKKSKATSNVITFSLSNVSWIINDWWYLQPLWIADQINNSFFYAAGLKKRKYSCSTSSEYFKVRHRNSTALFIIYYLWVTLEEKIKPLLIVSYAVVHSAVCAWCRSDTDEEKAPLASDANDVRFICGCAERGERRCSATHPWQQELEGHQVFPCAQDLFLQQRRAVTLTRTRNPPLQLFRGIGQRGLASTLGERIAAWRGQRATMTKIKKLCHSHTHNVPNSLLTAWNYG